MLGCLHPLPQSQEYHHFADDRTFLGVSNGLNVISNLPFLIDDAVAAFNPKKRIKGKTIISVRPEGRGDRDPLYVVPLSRNGD